MVTQTNQHQENNEQIKEVRVRFQFKTDNVKAGSKFSEQIKQVLHDVMMATKEFDHSTKLLSWDEENKTETELNGQEILLVGGDTIDKYINAPNKPQNLVHSKVYYHYGLRIKSKYPAYEFTEHWNNLRYNFKETHPILTSAVMRPAEMQTSSKTFPVGYFLGTTERGDYTTINNELHLITECNAEVSFQTVYQKGMSNIIWEDAKMKAEELNMNPQSKEYKRIKFKNSPTALIVYVSNKIM